MYRNCIYTLSGLLVLLASTSVSAAPITYTSRAAFDAAISDAGLSTATLDFDSIASGTTIPDGTGLGDVTFAYNFAGVQITVTDGNQFGGGGPFDTTSPPNFLGTDDADLFQSGDNFVLGFEASNAIGMYFVSADTIGVALLDDDIALAAGSASALLDTLAIEETLADGSNVFFLGIIDPLATFTSASVTSTCCGFFLYNIDDIITTAVAVPAPSTAALFAIAASAWLGIGVRRKSAPHFIRDA